MAEKEDPRAPYTVMARLRPGGGVEALGTAYTMEEAESLAEAAVGSGPYAIAHIYDRDSRHVRDVGRKAIDFQPPPDDGGNEAS